MPNAIGEKNKSSIMNTTLVLLGQLLSLSFGASVDAEPVVRIPIEPLHIAVCPLENGMDVWMEHEKGVRMLVAQQISAVVNASSDSLVKHDSGMVPRVADQKASGSDRKETFGTETGSSTGVVASTELSSSGAKDGAERG